MGTLSVYLKVDWQEDEVQPCVIKHVFWFIIFAAFGSALFSVFADWLFNHLMQNSEEITRNTQGIAQLTLDYSIFHFVQASRAASSPS